MKKINILIALAILALSGHAQEAPKAPIVKDISPKAQETKVKPFYQGEVVNIEHAGGYTYLEIKEHSEKTFWVAVSRAEVKKGDYVRFQKELVTEKFTSKTLNKTFDELMFASNLQYKVKK